MTKFFKFLLKEISSILGLYLLPEHKTLIVRMSMQAWCSILIVRVVMLNQCTLGLIVTVVLQWIGPTLYRYSKVTLS